MNNRKEVVKLLEEAMESNKVTFRDFILAEYIPHRFFAIGVKLYTDGNVEKVHIWQTGQGDKMANGFVTVWLSKDSDNTLTPESASSLLSKKEQLVIAGEIIDSIMTYSLLKKKKWERSIVESISKNMRLN